MDVVFGFLYRRTDYYKLIKSKDAKMGFPPGYASKVAYEAFDKFDKKARADDKEREASEKKPTESEVVEVPDIGLEEEVVMKEYENEDGKTTVVHCEGNRSTSDSYNGADRDNYSWTQNHGEIDVKVLIHDKDIKKFKVDYTSKSLKVTGIKNGTLIVLVEGELSHKVKNSETIWSIVPGEHLHISMEKAEEKWWESLLIGEEKISLNELDINKPFEELDDEAQAKIRELQQESIARLQGKMTPKQENIQNVLKKAWDEEGSPFRGQPYDPSVVKLPDQL